MIPPITDGTKIYVEIKAAFKRDQHDDTGSPELRWVYMGVVPSWNGIVPNWITFASEPFGTG